MQKLLLFIGITLCIYGAAWGQNWRPFRSTRVHGYRLSGGWSTRVHTLSLTAGRPLAAGDTVWGYNPALQPWDSCGQYAFKATSFSPFGNSLRKNQAGLTFYLKDSAGIPDSVVLRTGVAVGSSFTSGSHDVWYGGSDMQTSPAGTDDSVRIYQVDGQPAVWSKSYGLLRMPALTKSGYYAGQYFDQTYTYSQLAIDKVYGVKLPTEADFYDYAPGDTLGMYYQSFSAMGPQYWWRTVIRARWVDTAAGILLYRCTVWHKALNPGMPGGQNATYVLLGEDTLRFDLKQPVLCGFRDSTHPAMGYLIRNGGQGDSITEMEYMVGYQKGGSCYSLVIDGMTQYTLNRGRGVTFYDNGWGRGMQECYSIRGRGIPCGRIVTSTVEAMDKNCQLAQNPVSTELEVLYPTPLHLTLQDLQGRTVAEGQDTRTLDVRMLPPGLYQLRVQDKQGRRQVLRVAKD